MRKILLCLCLGAPLSVLAQESPFKISAYAELYYQNELSPGKRATRPSYVYSHHRNAEVNLNLGFIKAAYNSPTVRANLALGTGTYMQANYAAEPDVMKAVYEANLGIKLSKNHQIWLDAGVMPSHLGFESALGMDNWTLTRSLFADNSPYFETGAKLSYTNERWHLSALVLNGWQRIYRVEGNSTPAFGHQVTYKPNARWTLNSGSFIGNDKPDSLKRMRYFHNLYLIHQLSTKWALTAGLDVGAEQHRNGNAWWYTPVGILKYTHSEKLSISARGEYFKDQEGIIVSLPQFSTQAFSLNVDYTLFPQTVWRTEVKRLEEHSTLPTRTLFSFTTALAVRF